MHVLNVSTVPWLVLLVDVHRGTSLQGAKQMNFVGPYLDRVEASPSGLLASRTTTILPRL
jgi:hypothetical protein